MKEYHDREAAGQTGNSQLLIYESTFYNTGRWQGKWYYEGDEYDLNFSGTWSLSNPSNERQMNYSPQIN